MKTQKHPNILWICTDQQRYDTLGCYGNIFVKTPVLDSLAQNSVLFENAFCQSPVCTPSRGSFLTGRYPVTSRTRQNGADIPQTEVLITKLLRDAGYTCGLSGKLHLSACNPDSGCTKMERRIDDGYTEFHWSHDTAPVWGTYNEYYRWLKETYNADYAVANRPDSRWVQTGMSGDRHQTTWCAQKAIDFIETHTNGSPWLFSVNMYDPHHPFDPPQEYLEPYLSELDKIPLPDCKTGELENKPVWQRQDSGGAYNGHAGYPFYEMSNFDHKLVRAAYWAMCDLIDEQVGRIIGALEKTGQRENTIILFMSDHGELLGDHGIYLKGPFFYEPSIRVPLIINWQGTLLPRRCTALTQLMDLPQTLLDLCGLPQTGAMQGKSLAGLLRSNVCNTHHESVFCEYLNAMPWHRNPNAYASMVRTADYKLVYAHSLNTGELYDLCNDPGEQTNLFADPAYSGIKVSMLERLLNHWAHTCDPVPVRKSDW